MLYMMYIHKKRQNVARVYRRQTRAAGIFTFVREKYNCMKYRNSPYYKGAVLWDELPVSTRTCNSLLDFKKHLKMIYAKYNSKID